MSAIELVKTADGSYTLYAPDLGEHYHSVNGALQESNHVFVRHGLLHFVGKNPEARKIKIFEMGFGTGLNALLAMKVGFDLGLEMDYTSIEKFPVPLEVAETLEYGKLCNDVAYQHYFLELHQSSWGVKTQIDSFRLQKIHSGLEDFVPQSTFNVVFFDAFAPDVQPQLWSFDIFSKIYSAMDSGGILTTYSAKGDVRRNLMSAGFTVEKLQGPPGKRHMLRGTKM
jgi:tRNA U34 5-methylaminomethyl-2-thiouridine-forming methyltransferase MnmC